MNVLIPILPYFVNRPSRDRRNFRSWDQKFGTLYETIWNWNPNEKPTCEELVEPSFTPHHMTHGQHLNLLSPSFLSPLAPFPSFTLSCFLIFPPSPRSLPPLLNKSSSFNHTYLHTQATVYKTVSGIQFLESRATREQPSFNVRGTFSLVCFFSFDFGLVGLERVMITEC